MKIGPARYEVLLKRIDPRWHQGFSTISRVFFRVESNIIKKVGKRSVVFDNLCKVFCQDGKPKAFPIISNIILSLTLVFLVVFFRKQDGVGLGAIGPGQNKLASGILLGRKNSRHSSCFSIFLREC